MTQETRTSSPPQETHPIPPPGEYPVLDALAKQIAPQAPRLQQFTTLRQMAEATFLDEDYLYKSGKGRTTYEEDIKARKKVDAGRAKFSPYLVTLLKHDQIDPKNTVQTVRIVRSFVLEPLGISVDNPSYQLGWVVEALQEVQPQENTGQRFGSAPRTLQTLAEPVSTPDLSAAQLTVTPESSEESLVGEVLPDPLTLTQRMFARMQQEHAAENDGNGWTQEQAQAQLRQTVQEAVGNFEEPDVHRKAKRIKASRRALADQSHELMRGEPDWKNAKKRRQMFNQLLRDTRIGFSANTKGMITELNRVVGGITGYERRLHSPEIAGRAQALVEELNREYGGVIDTQDYSDLSPNGEPDRGQTDLEKPQNPSGVIDFRVPEYYAYAGRPETKHSVLPYFIRRRAKRGVLIAGIIVGSFAAGYLVGSTQDQNTEPPKPALKGEQTPEPESNIIFPSSITQTAPLSSSLELSSSQSVTHANPVTETVALQATPAVTEITPTVVPTETAQFIQVLPIMETNPLTNTPAVTETIVVTTNPQIPETQTETVVTAASEMTGTQQITETTAVTETSEVVSTAAMTATQAITETSSLTETQPITATADDTPAVAPADSEKKPSWLLKCKEQVQYWWNNRTLYRLTPEPTPQNIDSSSSSITQSNPLSETVALAVTPALTETTATVLTETQPQTMTVVVSNTPQTELPSILATDMLTKTTVADGSPVVRDSDKQSDWFRWYEEQAIPWLGSLNLNRPKPPDIGNPRLMKQASARSPETGTNHVSEVMQKMRVDGYAYNLHWQGVLGSEEDPLRVTGKDGKEKNVSMINLEKREDDLRASGYEIDWDTAKSVYQYAIWHATRQKMDHLDPRYDDAAKPVYKSIVDYVYVLNGQGPISRSPEKVQQLLIDLKIIHPSSAGGK